MFPRSADDVAAALAVCRELGRAADRRGGGTSMAGNAVGTGVVLDILAAPRTGSVEVDPERATARVEPGVVLDDVSAAAAPHGLRFGPDPSHARPRARSAG